MSLSNAEKEIMDKLRFSKGGSFFKYAENTHRVNPAEDGFLFIGLGGKGGKIVHDLKAMIYKNFNIPEGMESPANMQFLAIDTCDNDLQQLCYGQDGNIGLSSDATNTEVCQLFSQTAAAALEPGVIDHLPGRFKSWFNNKMGAKLTGDGAGGIRQAGRYLLFDTDGFTRILHALQTKLSKAYAAKSPALNSKINIFIFAGIGGGTGSGTIIDIPYIVRTICKNNGWDAHKISGYIMMPDTYPNAVQNKDSILKSVQRNTYAALKEINYYMLLESMHGTDRFQYEYAGLNVNSTANIFNTCFLITGEKELTGKMGDPDKESRRIVVDTVMNMVKSAQDSNQEFLVSSFMDNNPASIQMSVESINSPKFPKNAVFNFNYIGFGRITLPLDQIMAYTTYRMCEDIKQIWDQRATQEDVEVAMKKFRLLPQQMWEDIYAEIRNQGADFLSVEQFNDARPEDILDGSFHNHLNNVYQRNNVVLFDAMDSAAAKIESNLATQIEKFCTDSLKQKGLFYVLSLFQGDIAGTSVVNGFIKRLKNEYQESVNGFIATLQQRQKELEFDEKSLKEKMNEVGKIFKGKKGKFLAPYIDVTVEYFNIFSKIAIYEKVRDALNEIIVHMEGFMDLIGRYAEVWTHLLEIIQENYDTITKQPDHVGVKNDYMTNILDLAQEDDSTRAFRKYLDQQVMATNDEVRQVRAEQLIEQMLSTRDSWVSGGEFQPIRIFVQFVENQFAFIKNMTLQQFANIYFGPNNINQGIQSICQRLLHNGQILAKPSGIFSQYWNTWHGMSYITVPAGVGNMTTAISGFAANHGISIATGNDPNNISYIKMICGVPPYALDKIELYEKVYEEKIATNGLHINETIKGDLRKIPPLRPEKTWVNASENLREAEILEQYKWEIDKSIQNGLIEQGSIEEGAKGFVAYTCPYGSRLKQDEVIDWCKKEYLVNLCETDFEKAKQDFISVFKQKYNDGSNLKKTYVDIDVMYLNDLETEEEKLNEYARYYVVLMSKLFELNSWIEDCHQLIQEKIGLLKSKNKQQIAVERVHFYLWTGILYAVEDENMGNCMVLQAENGREYELCNWTYDFAVPLEAEIKLYQLSKELLACDVETGSPRKGINSEFLEELDHLAEEKKKERSAEMREAMKNGKKLFNDLYQKETKLINGITIRKKLETTIVEIDEIYDRFSVFVV